MRKWLAALVALALAAAAFCQTVAANDSAGAERALRSWITEEFKSRTRGNPRFKNVDPLRDIGWHFVFLVNTSNMSAKSAYGQMVRSTIRRFLDRQASQRGRQTVDLFSLYFYQLKLSSDPNSIVAAPVDARGVALFEKEMATTASTALGFGHDNATPRRELLRQLGNPDQARPIVLVQFTDISINENPRDPADDRRIREIPGQSGLLAGLPWAVYAVPGQPFTADDNRASYDVNVWVYGPESFTRASVASAPRQSWLKTAGLVVLGLALLAAVALLVWAVASKAGLFFGASKAYRVSGLGHPFVLVKGEAYTVCGPNASVDGPSVFLDDPQAPKAPMFQLAHDPKGVRLKCLLGSMNAIGSPDAAGLLLPGRHDYLFKFNNYTRTFPITVEEVQRR